MGVPSLVVYQVLKGVRLSLANAHGAPVLQKQAEQKAELGFCLAKTGSLLVLEKGTEDSESVIEIKKAGPGVCVGGRDPALWAWAPRCTPPGLVS